MENANEDNLLETLRLRLPFVLLALLLLSLVLMMRLTSLAIGALSAPDAAYVDAQRAALYEGTIQFQGARGTIYDRNGAELAVNQMACTVAINPPLIRDPLSAARQLSPLVERSVKELYEIAASDVLWQSLVSVLEPLPGERCQALDELAILGIDISLLNRRTYPQNRLAAQVIGFINYDVNQPSGFGIEGYYHNLLSGKTRDVSLGANLYDVPPDLHHEDQGHDLTLTLDREIQFFVEDSLDQALETTQAISGSIILMGVETGEVLAMANLPGYDPNRFFAIEDANVLKNNAISAAYEPGAIMIPITLAGALENKSVSPEWRFLDRGELIFSGQRVVNADLAAYGEVGIKEILVHGTQIGAAEVAIEMGATAFYEALGRFGLGDTTGIDLAGEAAGELRLPGHTEWSDEHLLRNSYGHLLEVTPMQLVSMYAAIANEGVMMQPHLVSQVWDHSSVEGARSIEPTLVTYGKRVLSAENAAHLLELLQQNIVNDTATLAGLHNYELAGYFARAAIPDLTGYAAEEYNMTFVGIFPVDEPEFVLLIKLEQPTSGESAPTVLWPITQNLMEKLVIQLEILPEADRTSWDLSDRMARSEPDAD
ncbi:MAG: penicillin-binding protein 2 [Chloroflexi bacterium]|nr:penicillin-binding protein 2 [Anaerolineaceae bacterium]MCY4106569.1 penicillin-binding protein 2 [Chloroflexota bacterium]